MKTYCIRLKWDGFKARPTRLAKGKYARLQGPGSVQIYRREKGEEGWLGEYRRRAREGD